MLSYDSVASVREEFNKKLKQNIKRLKFLLVKFSITDIPLIFVNTANQYTYHLNNKFNPYLIIMKVQDLFQ